MNIIKDFIERIKEENMQDCEIPALYIVEGPSCLLYDIHPDEKPQNIILQFNSAKYAKEHFILKYGNMQYVQDILVDNLIIKFTDFMNLYILNPNILVQIYKRNVDIIQLMLDNRSNNMLSALDRHILTNEKIQPIRPTISCNLIHRAGLVMNKLIFYISDLINCIISEPDSLDVQHELYLTIHTIAASNIASNLDALQKLYPKDKILLGKQNTQEINIEPSFQIKSELREILKKLTQANLIPVLQECFTIGGVVNIKESEMYAWLIIQMHILFKFYNNVMIICPKFFLIHLQNQLNEAGCKAYSSRIIFIDTYSLKHSLYTFIETCNWMQNPHIFFLFIQDNYSQGAHELMPSLINIASIFNKKCIEYHQAN